MGGVSYLEFLQDLEKKVDDDWDGISSSLEDIRTSLISRRGCLVNMMTDEKNLINSTKFVAKFLDSLPNSSSTVNESWHAQLPSVNEAIVIPTQVQSFIPCHALFLPHLYLICLEVMTIFLLLCLVNYVGKAGNIYDSRYQLKGSAYVISKYIGNTWLWDRVRVSGGAYGGCCDFDTHSGVFSYLSYRDPNLLKTLEVYDGTEDFLRELEMDDNTLTKAIIGTIGDVDSYQLPDAKGYSSMLRYLLGVTEEERQRRPEEILLTTLNDFKEFVDAIKVVKEKVSISQEFWNTIFTSSSKKKFFSGVDKNVSECYEFKVHFLCKITIKS